MNPRIPQIIADLTRLESKLRESQTAQQIANVLATIKSQSAELYLETDMEIIDQNNSTAESNPEPIEEVATAPIDLFKPSYEDDLVTPQEEVLEEISQNEAAPITENESNNINDTQEELFEQDETEHLDLDNEEEEEAEEEWDEEHALDQVLNSMVDDIEEEEELKAWGETINDSSDEELVEEDNFEDEVLEKSQEISDAEDSDSHNDQNENATRDLFSSEPQVVQNDANEGDNKGGQPHLEQKANEILSMFSFSRRFEFGNFLFGGDMKLFAVFISEMLAASNSDERDDVFDTWYNQRQWSRRDESANDLKRNLRKMM